MIRTTSFRSSSSRGDLSLAASKAAAISLLSSCEIAIRSRRTESVPNAQVFARVANILLARCYREVNGMLTKQF